MQRTETNRFYPQLAVKLQHSTSAPQDTHKFVKHHQRPKTIDMLTLTTSIQTGTEWYVQLYTTYSELDQHLKRSEAAGFSFNKAPVTRRLCLRAYITNLGPCIIACIAVLDFAMSNYKNLVHAYQKDKSSYTVIKTSILQHLPLRNNFLTFTDVIP